MIWFILGAVWGIGYGVAIADFLLAPDDYAGRRLRALLVGVLWPFVLVVVAIKTRSSKQEETAPDPRIVAWLEKQEQSRKEVLEHWEEWGNGT